MLLRSETAGAHPRAHPPATSPCLPSSDTFPARWASRIAAVLLTAYAVMAFSGSLSKGLSFDEGLQLAVGYNIWLNHDFRIQGANGDLVKRWATLPYLVSRPRFVSQDDPFWEQSRAYDLGWRFFFELGNRAEALLRTSRLMIVLLGAATGFLVFRAARALFGPLGGLVSLTLFAFSPEMLAFGAIVSTDMSITLTLFAATWAIWRLLQEITWSRLLASLASMALLVLAKPTALVIVPISGVLVAANLVFGRDLPVRWRDHRWRLRKRRTRLALFLALGVLHATCSWAAIWAHYEFRFEASPQPDDPDLHFFEHPTRDETPRAVTATVNWMRETHFLPQGFLAGLDLLLGCNDRLAAYMNGRWKLGGWWTFFPYAIWVKTSPTLFLLLGIGAIAWWRRTRHPPGPGAGPSATPTLYAVIPYLTLIGCYLAVAMTEDLNIGHRHVLPIYPALYVLAGASVIGFSWRRVRHGAAVLGLLGWLAVESLAVRPHYLAYFGPQAGGPERGYQHLVDSSLGWGMNLPGLKRWLDTNNPGGREPVFLAYFGSDSPAYHGIQARQLPGFFDRRRLERYPLTPGYYVISASILQGVYTAAFGPWCRDYERQYWATQERCSTFTASEKNPAQRAALLEQRPLIEWVRDFDVFDNLRFARLCAWLRSQGEPPENIGYATFIWKLDAAALEAALAGPPVELVDRPGEMRRFRDFEVLVQ